MPGRRGETRKDAQGERERERVRVRVRVRVRDRHTGRGVEDGERQSSRKKESAGERGDGAGRSIS